MGGPGLKHGVLRVWRQFSRINGEMVEAPLKTKKYLPYPASGREYGKRSGSTEEENGEQPLRVPLPGGRAHLPGQRGEYASPGPETGRTA